MHPDKVAGLAQEQVNKASINENLTSKKQNKQIDKSEVKNKSNKEDEPTEELFDHQIKTRSGRVSRPIFKYLIAHQGHVQTQAIKPQKY